MGRFIILFVIMWMASTLRAEDGYHIFTDTQGRSIVARVLSYDARSQTVSVQMQNGRNGKIPLSQLSEADTEYVRAWDLLKDFTSESRFKISAERNRQEDASRSGHRGNKELDVKDVCFEITLDNRTDAAFSDITLEYCIYYEQEDFKSGAGEVVCEQGIRHETTTIDSIAARSKKVLTTEKVKVFREELDSGWYYTSGSANVKHCDVHGIWLRASMAMPQGDKIVREYSLPDSLPNSRQWSDKSIKTGLN